MIVNFTNYKTGSVVSVQLEEIASSEVLTFKSTDGERQSTTIVTKQGEKYTVDGNYDINLLHSVDKRVTSAALPNAGRPFTTATA